MNIRDVWNILASATIITFLTSIFVFSQSPLYRATATIVSKGESFQVDVLYLQSANHILNMVRGGHIDFKKQPMFSKPVVQGFSLTSWLPGQSANHNKKPTNDYIVSLIQENLLVSAGKQPGLIDISFESTDQKLAAQVANLLASTYLRLDSQDGVERTLRLSKELEIAEKALLEYLSENPTADPSINVLKASQSEISNMGRALSLLQVNMAEGKNILTRLRKRRADNSDSQAPDAVIARDPNFRNTLQRKETLTARREEMAIRYGNKHLKMIALSAEIKEANRLLEQQAAAVVARLEDEIKAMIREELSLEKRLAMQEDKQVTLQALINHAKSLQLSVDAARRNFATGHSDHPLNESKLKFAAAAVPNDQVKPNSIFILLSTFFLTTLLLLIMLYWKFRISRARP